MGKNKPLSLDEIMNKMSEGRQKKISEDQELNDAYEKQRQHNLNERRIFEKMNQTSSSSSAAGAGGKKRVIVPGIAMLGLGAFTNTDFRRAKDNDNEVSNGTYSLNLPMDINDQTLYQMDVEYGLTEMITSTELLDGDAVGTRQYGSFAYNYDDENYYYLYYNSTEDDMEFRKIHPDTKVTSLVSTIISGYPDESLPDLIYLGSGDFGFIDPTTDAGLFITMGSTGSVSGTVSFDNNYPLNIFKSATEYFIFRSPSDSGTVHVADFNINTGQENGESSNEVLFTDSILSIEPFASFSGIKVKDCVAVASPYEVPGNSTTTIYANFVLTDSGTGTDPIIPYYVIAEIDPFTGTATYVTRGEGITDLFFF